MKNFGCLITLLLVLNRCFGRFCVHEAWFRGGCVSEVAEGKIITAEADKPNLGTWYLLPLRRESNSVFRI